MRRPTRKHVVCLVALGLGALLLGVGITVVSRIREAAAQSQCVNNFKQIGLAVATYSDIHNHLPPGTLPNSGLPPERRLSWFVAIVPYLEADNLYSRTEKTGEWDSPNNLEVLGIRYPYVRCPLIDRNDPRPIATYAGVTGVGADSPTLPVGHPRAGIFGYDRGTPRAAIKDGESNTIMLMEYGRGPVPWARGGEGTVAWFADAPHAGPGRPFGTPHSTSDSAFSRSVSCGNVGFANAHVQVIRGTVSPSVLEAMATIAGHESFIPPE